MALNHNDQQSFRDYLLGKLGGEDLKSFEERLLTDKDDFEELLDATEDDLADEYVCGQLSREDREAFETHYLITPERHEDIDFARALDRYLKKRPHPVPPPLIPTWILKVAMAVVVVGVIAIPVYRSFRPVPRIATITLSPSIITRGDSAQDAKINLSNADTLRVVLNLPPDVPPGEQYRAELENDRGDSQAVNLVNQESKIVTVEIPTQQLGKGRHAIKLLAPSPDSPGRRIGYYFTVE